MLVLDLFSGLGGFSQAFKDRGHKVITLDNDAKFKPDICADVMELDIQRLQHFGKFDIILASPPCTEFSKTHLPASWLKNPHIDIDGSIKLVNKTIEIINILKPQFWIIENVIGSTKYINLILGKYKKHVGSRYLWGYFPIFYCKHQYGKHNLPQTKNRPALRSLIPYNLSLNLCLAVENCTSCRRQFS